MAAVAESRGALKAGRRVRGSSKAGRQALGRGWVIATYVAIVFFVLWTVVPFVWMMLASLKTNKEIYQDFTLLPKSLYFGHYVALATGKFGVWMKNSALVSTVATTLSITLGALGAYAITRLRFAGRRTIAVALVCTYLVPSSLLFIPLFQIVARLELVDSIGGLMLV